MVRILKNLLFPSIQTEKHRLSSPKSVASPNPLSANGSDDYLCVTADWLLTGIQTSQALSSLWEQLTEKDQKELIQIMKYKISEYSTDGKLSNSKVEDQNIDNEDIA